MKLCRGCGEEIHPMRLEILPHTTTCVKCSKEAPKAGRLVSYGVGEDVTTELEVMDRNTYHRIRKLENNNIPNIDELEENDDYYFGYEEDE